MKAEFRGALVVAELIGGLALFTAIGAVILASTAISKMDRQFNEFVKTKLSPLQERIAEFETQMIEYRKEITAIETASENLKKNQEDMSRTIAKINESLDKLDTKLTDLRDYYSEKFKSIGKVAN